MKLRLRLLFLIFCTVFMTVLLPGHVQADKLTDMILEMDKKIHIRICGPNDENIVNTGSQYDRLDNIQEKLGLKKEAEKVKKMGLKPLPVLLIRSDEFYVYGTADEIYVSTEVMDKISSDDQLAFIIGHKLGHLAKSHITNEYNSKQKLSATIDRALLYPGKYVKDEDLQIPDDVAKAMLSSIKYSGKNEDEADAEGIKKVIEAGYDPEKALSVFDQTVNYLSDSISRTNSVDFGKRREKVQRVISDYLPIYAKHKVIDKALKVIKKEIDSETFVKPAQGDYSGYAWAKLNKEGNLILLVKGSGELPRADKDKIVLPLDASDIIILGVNPNTDDYFDVCTIRFEPDVFASQRYFDIDIPHEVHAKYVAHIIPKEACFVNEKIGIVLLMVKNGGTRQAKESFKEIKVSFVQN